MQTGPFQFGVQPIGKQPKLIGRNVSLADAVKKMRQ